MSSDRRARTSLGSWTRRGSSTGSRGSPMGFRTWFRRFIMGEEDRKSARRTQVKTVRFEKTDGLMPTRHGQARSFNLLSPIDLTLRPGEAKLIDLGLRCDRPV